ncbi:hypothetical protein SOASR032_05310 [Pragia fontium]|uniref:Pilus assembly protein E-set like domain-containing protein n=1 Tax=Pragia fontium TaxID=82985 RepID=A0ABQ5LG48_9GAMM|nr:TcfC E-set like domain-containing protein [Pragia fontium]GKX61962.1 hypothetical protein SOASR032_05310 [Pragia fontium]
MIIKEKRLSVKESVYLTLFQSTLLTFMLTIQAQADDRITFVYSVPDGFSESEIDDTAKYVATIDGITLPDFISYSPQLNKLDFDREKYRRNAVDPKIIANLQKIFDQLDYKQCLNGCDLTIEGKHVTVDKTRRAITLRSSENDYILPETSLGLVHNQNVDIRASSENYRAINLNSNAWLGMPWQSFGYLNWYSNYASMGEKNTHNQGISTYYIQKNFSSTYLRAGRQNSIDFASDSISTTLSPSFDQFVTIGSQSNLRIGDGKGELVLFSTAEGNYEFYRDGRMILKRPAVLGRNTISFNDLPGGYYSTEVRLVDRNGNTISRENHAISNVNYSGYPGYMAWHLTAGKDISNDGNLLEGGLSRDLLWFFFNGTAISGSEGKWATEGNISRPSTLGGIQVAPTLGVMSGEKGNGGYLNLSLHGSELGNLSYSRYQHSDVSYYSYGTSSSALSYSRGLGNSLLSYNYSQFSNSESHQVELRWNYRPNGLWSTFSLGVQKGGFQQSGNNYGIFFNTTWTLDRIQGSFSAARSGGQTQLSGNYRHISTDTFGTTTLGTTVSRINDLNNVNLYATREGSRGDVSLNLGRSANSNNADLNYRGMIAANTQGVALGRYSSSGSAMLLSTPMLQGIDYGFEVEGAPVGSNSVYAIPIKSYNDITFARVNSQDNDQDINVEVPANIPRAHPGQVYAAKASVDINLLYNGFLQDTQGNPVSGTIRETGDVAYPNGLFSIASKQLLPTIDVENKNQRFRCDLSQSHNNFYTCSVL